MNIIISFIYIHNTWNPNDLYFWRWTPQNKAELPIKTRGPIWVLGVGTYKQYDATDSLLGILKANLPKKIPKQKQINPAILWKRRGLRGEPGSLQFLVPGPLASPGWGRLHQVGRWCSFSTRWFSGSMLIFQGVINWELCDSKNLKGWVNEGLILFSPVGFIGTTKNVFLLIGLGLMSPLPRMDSGGSVSSRKRLWRDNA